VTFDIFFISSDISRNLEMLANLLQEMQSFPTGDVVARHERDQSFLVPVWARKKFGPDPDPGGKKF
jgi:hypothetical protein